MSKVLAIETSCDETAVAVLDCAGGLDNASFKVLGNALYSQASKHAEFGGVYPSLAKREHQSNLAPLTADALRKANLLNGGGNIPAPSVFEPLRDEHFKTEVSVFLQRYAKPDIDRIVVTFGPGLEPALWTGITFAEVLGAAWNVPVSGVDHMEGHLFSALIDTTDGTHFTLSSPALPLLGLLVSGGHTELLRMKEWFVYETVGQTKDDAVGEAFDKVARLLDLAYPGGPKIAELAEKSRERGGNPITFPRPMANDHTCDFSFSGLKTAVLYKLRSMEKLSETDKENIAEEFENAARDVLVIKARRALQKTKAKTFAVGGGVAANAEMRKACARLIEKEFPGVTLRFPHQSLTGDNAIMIGVAGYLRVTAGMDLKGPGLAASGNLARG